MKRISDAKLGVIFQVGICLLALCGIIIINTNSISYAQNSDNQVVNIEDEKTATEEIINKFTWIVEDNKISCIDEKGNNYTGIAYVDKGFRYFLPDGSLYTGWTTLAGKTFYFDITQMGLMATDEYFIDGMKYKFLPTGEFVTGWYQTESGTFYKNQFGFDETGLIVSNGKNYYVDPKTGLQIGKFELDHTYYTDKKGAILKGDCLVEGKSTHFDPNGNYLYGWLCDENGFTYQDINGVRYSSGKKNVEGIDFYFDENGYLVTNKVIGMYSADSVGRLTRMPISVNNLNAALDEILAVTGKDITAIGEYVRTHHAYRYRDKMATREEMAVYALNNRYISCYYYEALAGLLLERAGYEVITVAGKGFVYAEHYWSLVKTSRNGIEGYYHVDSLKSKYVKTDAEMVSAGFKWPHENYPATP